MAIEVGTAYISILPETSKIAPGISKALSGAQRDVGKAGAKSGGGFVSGFTGILGKGLKVGGLAAGTAVAAGVGTALFKGMQRLTAIDDARAKLTGLGHDTQAVDKIMANALASVKGTAFGLGDAASVAASAVASGVKPGEDLERTLSLVGDAATIAGVGINEMGPIFNKVAAGGKVTGDVMNQLGDRGIPILQLLGDEMGTSAEETRKMVSAGKVDFDTFRNAIETGMGGAAQESGKTFRGAMANTQAALGRVGAALLGGVFEKLPGMLATVIGWLDKLTPVAEKVGDVIGDYLGKAVDWIMGLADRIGPAIGVAVDVVGEFLGAFRGGGDDVAAFQTPVSRFAGTVKKALLPVLSGAKDLFDALRDALERILPAIGGLVSHIAEGLAPLLPVIVDLWGRLATQIMDLYRKVIPGLTSILVDKLIPAAKGVWDWIAKNLIPVFVKIADIIVKRVVPLVSQIVRWFVDELVPAVMDIVISVGRKLAPVFTALTDYWRGTLLPVVETLLKKFREWWPTISKVIMIVVKLIGWVLKIAAAILGKVLPPLMKFAGFLIRVVFKVIVTVIDVIVRIVAAFIRFGRWVSKVWGWVKQAISAAWNRVIKPVFEALWGFIRKTLIPIFTRLWNNVVKPVFKKIGDFIRGAWNNVIKPVFAALRDFLVKQVVQRFETAKQRITRAWEAVRDMVKNVWNNGIKPIFTTLRNWVRDTIPDAFRSARDAIGRIWDNIKEYAAKPVRFIIRWVYNEGLRKMMNLIPGVNLGYVKLAFARGGVVPGWSPGRDVHTFYSPTGGILRLSGGEAIMRPEFTRRVGGASGVDAINRAAQRGQAFARGGTFQPVPGSGNRHSGYSWATWAGDFPVPMGTPVRAWKAGVIAATRFLTTSYGVHIRMNHDDGTSSLYAHLSRILVRVGQQVPGGFRIGLSGSTGNSTGPHLHFETMGGQYSGGAGSEGGGGWFGSRWFNAIKSIPAAAKRMWGYVTQLRDQFGEWGGKFFGGVTTWITDAAKWVDDKIPNRFLPDNPVQDVLRRLARGRDVLGMFANLNSNTGNTGAGPAPTGNNQALVRRAMLDAGFGANQWGPLYNLVSRESGFRNTAQNPTSTAYGMFQFLNESWPAGFTKTSDPWQQAQAGMKYIRQRYGSPAAAWAFWQRNRWYDQGGILPAGGVAMNASKRPEAVFNGRQFRRVIEATASTASQGGSYALTITNWEDGTGYLEAIADDRVEAAGMMTGEIRRAGAL